MHRPSARPRARDSVPTERAVHDAAQPEHDPASHGRLHALSQGSEVVKKTGSPMVSDSISFIICSIRAAAASARLRLRPPRREVDRHRPGAAVVPIESVPRISGRNACQSWIVRHQLLCVGRVARTALHHLDEAGLRRVARGVRLDTDAVLEHRLVGEQPPPSLPTMPSAPADHCSVAPPPRLRERHPWPSSVTPDVRPASHGSGCNSATHLSAAARAAALILHTWPWTSSPLFYASTPP